MADTIEQPQDVGIIDKFKNSLRQWWGRVEAFKKEKPASDSMLVSQKKIVDAAVSLRKRIESIPTMENVFAATALGAWPLLVGAAVVGAVGGVMVYQQLNDREMLLWQEQNYKTRMLVAGGMNPREAVLKAHELQEAKPKTWADVAHAGIKVLPWIFGGYVVFKIYRKYSG